MNDLGKLLDVVVRPAGGRDLGFVIDSWGRSLRDEYPDARTTDFVGAVRDGIGRRLNAGGRVLIAHPAGEPDLILGWCCCSDAGVVHFVYVRRAYRRLGIARTVVSCAVVTVGAIHADAMTDDARAIKRTHPDAIRYLPTV